MSIGPRSIQIGQRFGPSFGQAPSATSTFFSIPSTTVGSAFGRPTTLITPDSFDPSVPLPLLLLLHAFGETTASIQARLGLTSAPFMDDGCLMLVPDAIFDSGGLYFNYWDLAAGDFAYLTGIVAEVKSRFAVSHVWGVGYSNGGMMTQQLDCQFPSLYDAMFTFSCAGGTSDPVTPSGHPKARWHWHGTLDATVLPAGDPTANFGGVQTGHGGVGSTGYVDTATTLANHAARNGVTGGVLGAPGTAFDFVTSPTGAETADEVYTGTGVPPNIVRMLGTGAAHGFTVQSINGTNPGGTLIFRRLRSAAP